MRTTHGRCMLVIPMKFAISILISRNDRINELIRPADRSIDRRGEGLAEKTRKKTFSYSTAELREKDHNGKVEWRC